MQIGDKIEPIWHYDRAQTHTHALIHTHTVVLTRLSNKLMVGHFAHLVSANLTETVSTCECEGAPSKTPQFP